MEKYIWYVIFLPVLNKYLTSKYGDPFNCLGADTRTQANRFHFDILFFFYFAKNSKDLVLYLLLFWVSLKYEPGHISYLLDHVVVNSSSDKTFPYKPNLSDPFWSPLKLVSLWMTWLFAFGLRGKFFPLQAPSDPDVWWNYSPNLPWPHH